MKENDKIELRSEDIQEVLGKVPPWILRWGITAIAAFVTLLLVGSAVFKYPDVISGQLTLTGRMPPAEVVAKVSGRMSVLYVEDNQQTGQGECLALIENSADFDHVIRLKDYLRELEIDTEYTLPLKDLRLGPMQAAFSGLYTALFDYSEFLKLNYYPDKKEFIGERISQLRGQYRNAVRQQAILREQLALSSGQYTRDSVLYGRLVISAEELEKSKSAYLQTLLSYESMGNTVNNLTMQITQMDESLLDNKFQFRERENALRTQLISLISQLLTDIETWEMTYLLSAPVDGRVTFTNYWVKNQNVSAGETVFTIIPTDSVGLVGKVLLPASGTGKVNCGNKVNIRFDNFPDHEFGKVVGTVSNVSIVPTRVGEGLYYALEVDLPQGLTTTYNKELPYMPNMLGQADVVTENITLLERFLMPIRKVLTNGRQ